MAQANFQVYTTADEYGKPLYYVINMREYQKAGGGDWGARVTAYATYRTKRSAENKIKQLYAELGGIDKGA